MKNNVRMYVRNIFHKTGAHILIRVEHARTGYVSVSRAQAKTMEKKLCGVDGCTCSGFLGEKDDYCSDVLSTPSEKNGRYYFHVSTAVRVLFAEDVEDLCEILNTETYDSENYDYSALPVFGGRAPKDTEGIYSWDQDSLLVTDYNGRFVIKSR